MDMLKKAWQWLVYSSANAEKTSLSVKMAGLALIPLAMKVVLFSCSLGVLCLSATPDDLSIFVIAISNLLFWSLSIVATIGFLIGFVRKVGTTITGTNRVVWQW